MSPLHRESSRAEVIFDLLVAGLMLTAIAGLAIVAPTESSMGQTQRILYVHVSVAWFSLLSFGVMALTGMLYLWHRDLKWDAWAHAAGEVGWLCCSLTLVTGSLWAHSAWATWWTWDPRLTTMFILWMFYCGALLVRGSLRDPHHCARLSAVLATVGILDVPLVIMATRWFRGIHPVTPEMEPSMVVVLVICVVSFTMFLSILLLRRQVQLRLQQSLCDLRQQTET